MNYEKQTVYEARVKDITGHYTLAFYGETEQNALRWLSDQPEGGQYRNALHGYEFTVKPGEYTGYNGYDAYTNDEG